MKTLPMLLKTSDGSWLDENGRYLFLTIDRFVKDIAQGDCCFICKTQGKTQGQVFQWHAVGVSYRLESQVSALLFSGQTVFPT